MRWSSRRRNTRCWSFSCGDAGAVVSRADIAEHVWDEHYDPLSNVVDVHIQRLRRKLDRSGMASIIRTRRGEGYQLSIDAGVS